MNSLKTIGLSGEGKEQFPPGEFWKKYDAGEFGKPITTFRDPAFKQWMKEVAALPAEKQVEAVAKKLQELNPGYDGKVTGFFWDHTPRVENGVVTEFGFNPEDVTDISPVRALERLRSLRCAGIWNGRVKKFSDLSPLKGMPLTSIDLTDTSVADLSPLQGMKLVNLSFRRTWVNDLWPLKGMPLTEINVSETGVSDLSPLKGMPLTCLRCFCHPVSDLSPLKGMSLTVVDLLETNVSDLSPLKGMPLTVVVCNETPVSDLSPLEGMNLTDVGFTPKNITKGLDVIRKMKSLKAIGPGWNKRFPPDEFWKKYDAGEFNK
jgi:hypothetical protein